LEHRSRLRRDAPSYVTTDFKSMGNWVYVFLVGAILVLFAWLEFLALLIGGAFFTAMAESSPRSWIGISIFGCGSAVGLPSGIIILDWSLESEREIDQERIQEIEQIQETEGERAYREIQEITARQENQQERGYGI
jgi:hypothetical protein